MHNNEHSDRQTHSYHDVILYLEQCLFAWLTPLHAQKSDKYLGFNKLSPWHQPIIQRADSYISAMWTTNSDDNP